MERADIGILGGGQLARMLLQAAARLGLDVAIMERVADSPAGRLTRREVVAEWNDEEALRRFAAMAPAILLESEFVPARSLHLLERHGARVVPGSAALAAAQDKLYQKARLDDAGLPVAPFRPVDDAEGVHAAARELGWPLLLKRRRDGYDGYGNRLLRGPDDVAPAIYALRGRGGTPGDAAGALMVEGYVPFTRELAVMVVRGDGPDAAGGDGAAPGAAPANDDRGEVRVYPVVETMQRDGICHEVRAPAAVSPAVAARAAGVARSAVEALELRGVVGVELFLVGDDGGGGGDRLVVNEVAPRVHNSGHYTIEACATSQFENAVRAALGWPLGDTAMIAPAAAMINLLGATLHEADLPGTGPGPDGLAAALAVPGARVHLYGKRQSRPGRKMGHVTALGVTVDDARAVAARAADQIRA